MEETTIDIINILPIVSNGILEDITNFFADTKIIENSYTFSDLKDQGTCKYTSCCISFKSYCFRHSKC